MAKVRLYFLGDIHADFVWLSFAIVQSKIKDSTIIQVGDFGLGFLKNEEEQLTNLNNVCVLNNVMLYAIRGNHDDPSAFNSENRFSNLKFLKDYTRLTIYCLNVLLIGGSTSINGLSSDEVFYLNRKKIALLLNGITKVDIVVTH